MVSQTVDAAGNFSLERSRNNMRYQIAAMRRVAKPDKYSHPQRLEPIGRTALSYIANTNEI